MYDDLASLSLRPDSHAPARGRVHDRIVDDVVEHELDLVRIEIKRRQVFRHHGAEFNPFFRRRPLERAEHTREYYGERLARELDAKAPFLDARDIEQVVHQVEHPPERVEPAFRQFFLSRIEGTFLAGEQRFDRPRHASKRRPELVRRDRDELALGALHHVFARDVLEREYASQVDALTPVQASRDHIHEMFFAFRVHHPQILPAEDRSFARASFRRTVLAHVDIFRAVGKCEYPADRFSERLLKRKPGQDLRGAVEEHHVSPMVNRNDRIGNARKDERKLVALGFNDLFFLLERLDVFLEPPRRSIETLCQVPDLVFRLHRRPVRKIPFTELLRGGMERFDRVRDLSREEHRGGGRKEDREYRDDDGEQSRFTRLAENRVFRLFRHHEPVDGRHGASSRFKKLDFHRVDRREHAVSLLILIDRRLQFFMLCRDALHDRQIRKALLREHVGEIGVRDHSALVVDDIDTPRRLDDTGDLGDDIRHDARVHLCENRTGELSLRIKDPPAEIEERLPGGEIDRTDVGSL